MPEQSEEMTDKSAISDLDLGIELPDVEELAENRIAVSVTSQGHVILTAHIADGDDHAYYQAPVDDEAAVGSILLTLRRAVGITNSSKGPDTLVIGPHGELRTRDDTEGDS